MPVERRALTSGATIRDRVAQTAATLVLEPIFEADMDPAAHGYRPGRSAGQAIQTVLALLRQGYTDGVDADLSKYFDTIPHDELMQSLARRIVDATRCPREASGRSA
jgi:RNA-directed DNA polymerase